MNGSYKLTDERHRRRRSPIRGGRTFTMTNTASEASDLVAVKVIPEPILNMEAARPRSRAKSFRVLQCSSKEGETFVPLVAYRSRRQYLALHLIYIRYVIDVAISCCSNVQVIQYFIRRLFGCRPSSCESSQHGA